MTYRRSWQFTNSPHRVTSSHDEDIETWLKVRVSREGLRRRPLRRRSVYDRSVGIGKVLRARARLRLIAATPWWGSHRGSREMYPSAALV